MLREKLFTIGVKVVRHGRYVTLQMAELAILKTLFAEILRLIDGLWPTQVHPYGSTGQVCAARAGVRSHSAKRSLAGLSIAKSAR